MWCDWSSQSSQGPSGTLSLLEPGDAWLCHLSPPPQSKECLFTLWRDTNSGTIHNTQLEFSSKQREDSEETSPEAVLFWGELPLASDSLGASTNILQTFYCPFIFSTTCWFFSNNPQKRNNLQRNVCFKNLRPLGTLWTFNTQVSELDYPGSLPCSHTPILLGH